MSRSAAEVFALAERAARGAGFPSAQATLFGRATVSHLDTGASETALLDALATPDNSPILRLPLVLDDLMRVLRVTPEGGTLTLMPQDAEMAPAYALLAPTALTLSIETGCDGPPRLVFAPSSAPISPPPTRLSPTEELLRALSRYAAKTYVPSSVTGRRGAGAGNIDNA